MLYLFTQIVNIGTEMCRVEVDITTTFLQDMSYPSRVYLVLSQNFP